MNLRSIDLNLLLAFDAVMQERNVSRAAERIFRSQSAVSHALGKLRKNLDDELFIRIPGGVEPTSRAKDFAIHVSAALTELQGALDHFFEFDPLSTCRRFRVGVSDYTAISFLPSLIRSLHYNAPDSSINVFHIGNDDLTDALHTSNLDCLILGNKSIESKQAHRFDLLEDKMISATWKENSLLDSHLTLESFINMPHLQISADGISPGVVDIELKKQDLHRNVVGTVPYYLVAPEIIMGTDIVTTFGDGLLHSFYGNDEIKLFRPPIELPMLSISMFVDKRLISDPGNIWFRSLILEHAERLKSEKEQLYLHKLG